MRRRRRSAGRAASSRRSRRRRPSGDRRAARSRAAARAASKPQGATITISGSAASTSSQVTGRDGAPASPSTSAPPASATISGSQWPLANGGSCHSARNTRRRGSPSTAAAAEPIVSRMPATTGAASSGRPSRPRDRVHRLLDLGDRVRVERQHVAVKRLDPAHLVGADGAHPAQVLRDHQVRVELADQRGVHGVQGAAVEHGVADGLVDLGAAQRLAVDPRAGHHGERATRPPGSRTRPIARPAGGSGPARRRSPSRWAAARRSAWADAT